MLLDGLQGVGDLRIVLCETSHPGNIGAAARAMKVMGLSHLVLVNPQCEVGSDARARASGASDLIDQADTFATLDGALMGVEFVVGTSARRRHLGPDPVAVRQGADELVVELRQGRGCAVVFGPERTGLDTDSLERCHRLWHIPTSNEYASLNLAAAVQVVAYELFLARSGKQTTGAPTHVALADASDVQRLCEHFQRVAVAVDFAGPSAPESVWHRVRRLARRARLEAAEVKLLRGFLSATERATRGS